MEIEKIMAVGLTKPQATAYALLIEKGEVSPSQSTASLQVTRTNAYKVLDSLVEVGLAQKHDKNKKLVYSPTNPTAISNLVAEQRNIAAAREEAAQALIADLLTKFHSHDNAPACTVVTGRRDVAEAYRAQINQKQPIYFLRSRADIPIMGFDTMREIRVAPSRHGLNRYGINPDIATGTTATNNHQRSNFTRTWVKQEDYTAPVEWSVSGSSLIIVVFSEVPHAITIDHPVVAEAFRQIWHLLNNCLKAMPYYKDLPR